jgi:hypothetical protein
MCVDKLNSMILSYAPQSHAGPKVGRQASKASPDTPNGDRRIRYEVRKRPGCVENRYEVPLREGRASNELDELRLGAAHRQIRDDVKNARIRQPSPRC